MFMVILRAASVVLIGTVGLGLAACSGAGAPMSTPNQQIAQQPRQLSVVQVAPNAATVCSTPPVAGLQVTPRSLSLTVGKPGHFTVCTQYFSTYALTVAPSGIVSVPASATPTTNPVTGIKLAPITVTPLAAGSATITVTDKKGHVAKVAVIVTKIMANRIFVGDLGNANTAATVRVYDEEGNTITTSGNFPDVTNAPGAMAFDTNNHHLYVPNGPTVKVYDKDGNPITTTGTFPNLQCPRAITFDSHNHQLYITNFCSLPNVFITVYDEEGNQITTTGSFPNLKEPVGIAFDSNNNQLYVTNTESGPVTVYDEEGNQVTTTGTFPGLHAPTAIAFDSKNHRLYITSLVVLPFVGVYDEEGNQLTTTGTFPTLVLAGGIVFDPKNNRLYVTDDITPSTGTVKVFDEEGNKLTTTGSFPNVLFPISIAAGS